MTTNDAELAAKLRRLRNGGQIDRYHHLEFGVNSRLDEMQAAILRARLPLMPAWTAKRRERAAAYRRALTGASVVVPRECDPGHVYHLFPVLTPRRDAFQAHLVSHGIGTLVHYPVPIPRQPALARCRRTRRLPRRRSSHERGLLAPAPSRPVGRGPRQRGDSGAGMARLTRTA